jgi:hypothetical protein
MWIEVEAADEADPLEGCGLSLDLPRSASILDAKNLADHLDGHVAEVRLMRVQSEDLPRSIDKPS